MKKLLYMFLCLSFIGLTACGAQQEETQSDTQDKTQSETEAQSLDNLDTNNYEAVDESSEIQEQSTEEASIDELSDEEMLEQFYQQFYGDDWTSEDIVERLADRGACYQENCYYDEITYYWESVRGVTDISNLTDPLYFTDMKYYTVEDFADATPTVIHLAKNEIYAKHGYIFQSEDLNNYFLGCAWYTPACTAEEFETSVFNDFERKNLELLAELDKQGFREMISSANQEDVQEAVIEASVYNVEEYGYVETREQHYSNAQGEEGYYYTVDCFYLDDDANSGKYALVNQTLQEIYDMQEKQYQVYCAEQISDYEVDDSITNELQSVNYVSWYLVNIPYIGEDYVSILFNDIVYYAGAAHPITYFSPVTISVETGEIVTPQEILNKSWDVICDEADITVESEEVFNEEYGFYLTDHTLTYKYRTNVFVDEIVIRR